MDGIKIGIIGGGVIGRLILNTLLVYEKDGIKPSNLYLSTRQYEDLQFYNTQFGVNVSFDNEAVARQVDMLIITVPATLDNWVINDMKEALYDNARGTANGLQNNLEQANRPA